jgi:hypothetical protein
MKKILILGSCGAGKSTLAKKLQEVLEIDIIHLDQYYWKPSWTRTEKEEWQNKVSDLTSGESWIMDGNYRSTLDIRIPQSDAIIWLDFSPFICFRRVLKRRIRKNRLDDIAGCRAPEGVPDPPQPGAAYADETIKADGVEEGMTILLGPARSPVEIIGFVSDTNYNGQSSLWAAPETWRSVLAANRPDAQLADGVYQALVVQGSGDLPAAIDAATDGATESYTVDGAVDAIPGVEEQQSTFAQIIGVTLVVALVVIALFFALLTVERTALYGVLKALGARSGTLFAGLMVQAVVVTAIASLVAGSLVVILDLVIPPGSIPLQVTASRIASSVALLLVAAVIGCSFSLRRVLRVDPASAIGTGS